MSKFFSKKADLIISYFKKIINNQIVKTDERYHYGYLKMVKNNQLKKIEIELILEDEKEDSESYFQLVFPLRDNINFLYKKLNLNTFNKKIYLDISRDLFIELNYNFFQFFNLDKNDVYYDPYDFKIKDFEKEKIDIIFEKINLEKELNEF